MVKWFVIVPSICGELDVFKEKTQKLLGTTLWWIQVDLGQGEANKDINIIIIIILSRYIFSDDKEPLEQEMEQRYLKQ